MFLFLCVCICVLGVFVCSPDVERALKRSPKQCTYVRPGQAWIHRVCCLCTQSVLFVHTGSAVCAHRVCCLCTQRVLFVHPGCAVCAHRVCCLCTQGVLFLHPGCAVCAPTHPQKNSERQLIKVLCAIQPRKLNLLQRSPISDVHRVL